LSLGNFNVVHRYIGFNLFETSQGFIPPFKAAVSGTAAGAHGFPFSDQLPAMFVDSGSRRAKIWRTGEKVLSIKSSVEALLAAQRTGASGHCAGGGAGG
jgi:hypothetical protein